MRLRLIAPPGSPGSCFDAFLCGARTPGLSRNEGQGEDRMLVNSTPT